jgi:tryptophan halogenase
MTRRIVIVGGGTAGWLTAAYLARALAAQTEGGASITLVESPDIGILGVGEGTFPSIRNTLQRIGLDEAAFMADCNATFKQGIHFAHWRHAPGEAGRDHYFHPFQTALQPDDLDLLPYWLIGHAPEGLDWDEAAIVQKDIADRFLGPKRPIDQPYGGPLNYAYHFDATRFAKLLRWAATQLGVVHVEDTVARVTQAENGDIVSITTRDHGDFCADLFIDCSGFRAELIGKTLQSPFVSCRDVLFCDRAVAMQVPYDRPDAPIPCYTISTAQKAGWTWDIGLDQRRGIGHVYSSSHMSDDEAETVIRRYIGRAAEGRDVRSFKFEGGYRPASWVKNCVAVGLSGGFFEPLEATGIVFAEVSAVLIANLFPWAGEMESAARQFNRIMTQRYERAVDFLKMHYCLSRRTDSDFWRDNVNPATFPDSLKDYLDRWRTRPPSPMDFDMNYHTFGSASWQFVLYGMGFKTDISARAAVYSQKQRARAQFAEIRRQAGQAIQALPTHRALIDHLYKHGYQQAQSRV